MYELMPSPAECKGPKWAVVTNYSDVPPCVELMATFDDNLKKDHSFTNYAVMVAQEILGKSARASYGKWGARLCTGADNPGKKLEELMTLAGDVIQHPSWIALYLSTHVFTCGGTKE